MLFLPSCDLNAFRYAIQQGLDEIDLRVNLERDRRFGTRGEALSTPQAARTNLSALLPHADHPLATVARLDASPAKCAGIAD
jgi:hypothetical protein